MELKGSKTEANLMAAFAGESQARNKYTFAAEQAKKEGYRQIAQIFTDTADNERAHANLWYRILHGDRTESTQLNLRDAASGENYEWTEMYKTFAQEAKEEGFDRIAKLFEAVGKIEQEHEKRFLKLAENVEENLVFRKDSVTVWQCRNCGHIHVAVDAPSVCPVCGEPQSYFQMKEENY
ncbi:MAG TPA: rubrerythrin family protein [Ruminococcaceae bacterium]|nr:rubrerythrin family protein [Oscillospiraceae bacterium]